MKVSVVLLLLCGVALVQAQQYDGTDFDVWQDQDEQPAVETETYQILQDLCENYHVLHQNSLIDCTELRILPKVIQTDEFIHGLHRRSATDNEEGSGQIDEALFAGTNDPNKDNEATSPERVEVSITEENTVEKGNVKSTNGVPPDTITEKSHQNETKSSDKPVDEVAKQVTGDKGEEKDTTILPATSTATSVSVSQKESGVLETTQHAMSTVHQSSSEPPTTQQPSGSGKEREDIAVDQSGSAVIMKSNDVQEESTLETEDNQKALDVMNTHAETSGDKENPVTGESSLSSGEKSNKDTTILIVLFAVVIIIGAAAFTHNFIKKRRQKRQNVEASANGKTDVEQGTEMKPLIKTTNTPVIVKEYTDTDKKSGEP